MRVAVEVRDSGVSQGIQALRSFIEGSRPTAEGRRTAVSLFSGAGLSDIGYELAGFKFVVQTEVDEFRAALGQDNFPGSSWVAGDVREVHDDIVNSFRDSSNRPLDLLVATPPCQGMSSSNPSRGRRRTSKAMKNEAQNRLILELIPLARLLKPRVIVAENVRPILTLCVTYEGRRNTVIKFLEQGLEDYEVFHGVVNMAEYGIPQTRKRAVVVAVRKDEVWLEPLADNALVPWPRATHFENPSAEQAKTVSVKEWFKAIEYEPLDARSSETSRGTHRLHFVPTYEGDYYPRISDIPPYSGQNAFENDTCPECNFSPVAEGLVFCPACDSLMRNRPYVEEDGGFRLVKGFHSSYRRIHPDKPAPTIMTNSSHVGGDFKIHPWENRVLSMLECSDLQTVPRFYDWSRAFEGRRPYQIRTMVGEAFPPYFTYLHGLLLNQLLSGAVPLPNSLANRPKRS